VERPPEGGEEEEEEAVAPIGGFGDWDQVALEQGQMDLDSLRGIGKGLAAALEDRSIGDNWRKIFVVFSSVIWDGRVEVYDRNSQPIDEPSRGILKGLQTQADFIPHFGVDAGDYRSPLLRRAPRSRPPPSGSQPPKKARVRSPDHAHHHRHTLLTYMHT
jgi:hypothetical protein